MAVEAYPFGMSGKTYSAEILRRAMNVAYARNAAGTPGTMAGGVIGSGDLVVSAPASGLNVNVAAGECWVPGTALYASTPSGYYFRNTATFNVTGFTANATNPTIYMVCATVSDGWYHGSDGPGVVQAVSGTPTAGATLANLSGAPALPDASLLLGYVLVPATATNIVTADIQDARGFAKSGLYAPGSLLGRAQYNPVGGQQYTFSSNTTTAVDNTNLPVTFTVPGSGSVIFRFTCNGSIPAYSGGTTGVMGTIWDVVASSELSSAYRGGMFVVSATGGTVFGRATYEVLVTSLTPGASKTWAPGQSNNATSCAFYAGAGASAVYSGPFVVELIAA
ncbi:MAG: hypothetical protein JWM85_2221 [Acidimicrobiaceae bacterium]|nr:hypothetical protein [Acidimicrobiaceae bacterium]